MVGVPAKQIGWMSKFGEQLDLPVAGSGQAQCPQTGDKYILVDGALHQENNIDPIR
jgi:UDP-2-acetamido-3-amino-2,3-dideoxy-glucuronate N-acetyltransferase